MMNKKGQGISINVIIIAAIALLVLVVLAVLILRSGSSMTEGTACTGVGGTCTPTCSNLNEGTTIYTQHPTAKCDNPGDKCCVKLGNDE